MSKPLTKVVQRQLVDVASESKFQSDGRVTCIYDSIRHDLTRHKYEFAFITHCIILSTSEPRCTAAWVLLQYRSMAGEVARQTAIRDMVTLMRCECVCALRDVMAFSK